MYTDMPSAYFDLLTQCTHMTPAQRPTFSDAVRVLERLMQQVGAAKYKPVDGPGRLRSMSMGAHSGLKNVTPAASVCCKP